MLSYWPAPTLCFLSSALYLSPPPSPLPAFPPSSSTVWLFCCCDCFAFQWVEQSYHCWRVVWLLRITLLTQDWRCRFQCDVQLVTLVRSHSTICQLFGQDWCGNCSVGHFECPFELHIEIVFVFFMTILFCFVYRHHRWPTCTCTHTL